MLASPANMTTPTAGLYHTTNDSSSTLRPRNTRLISYLDDEPETPDTAKATTTSSSTSAPLFDRAPSPNVSRNRSRDHSTSATGSGTSSRKISEDRGRPPTNDVWSSWTSIASSLLGGDGNSTNKGKRNSQIQPKWMKQDRTYVSSPTTPHWGPKVDGPNNVTASSLEDRQALLQAKKREALLLGSAEEPRDASGRYKRRDSDADLQAPSRDLLDEDALVYVHKIKREDTLAGVMLKYGCQPDVFRKVNRFWPNDNIQVRNHVFLPVEACTIRGKKVDGPHASSDLLGPAIEDLAKTTTSGKGALKRMGTHNAPPLPRTPPEAPSPSEPFPNYTSISTDNPDLKHDSWVLLPNFPDPIAILRIPRSSLGYFPRARRKSFTKTMYSDTASPRSSFESLRHPPTHAAQMALSQSLTTSPVRRPASGLTAPSLVRKRSSSTATTTTTTTSSSAAAQHAQPQPWSTALTGPGGVGTLRGLRTEPSRPGPAEDSLNRTFKAYFPDLSLTDPQQALASARALAPPPAAGRALSMGGGGGATGSYRNSPRASMDSVRSVRSNSSGLGELAVGVEGWVRRVAGGGGVKGLRPGGKNAGNATPGGLLLPGGATGMEDLIELEMTPGEERGDALDQRAAGDGDLDGEGEEMLTPTAMDGSSRGAPMRGLPGIGEGGKKAQRHGSEDEPDKGKGQAQERNEQDLLDERFPVRGRVRSAYERGGN